MMNTHIDLLKTLAVTILALLLAPRAFAAVDDMTLKPLWLFAGQLKNSIGHDAAVLDSIFETPVVRSNPDFADRLTAGSFTLDGGVKIQNIVIRLNHNQASKVYIISFDIGGVCILRRDVQKKWPELELFEVPRGHYKNATFSWVTPVDKNGNGIGFGFPQLTPSCLKNMTLRNFAS